MQTVKYIDFLPGGNKTALVTGGSYDADAKKRINDAIMASDPDIEQVGFVAESIGDPDGAAPFLQMAGGEFCGNATRSAAYYYLDGKPGTLTMTVSGGRQVACGVYGSGDAWCEIPLPPSGAETQEVSRRTEAPETSRRTETIAPGIHKVRLSGITHLVLEPETAAAYLSSCAGEPEKLKREGFALIERCGLKDEEAAGAIFTELPADGRMKIHPIVWVRGIASLFYETACGSGTVAAAIALAGETAFKASRQTAGSKTEIRKSEMLFRAEIMQPSGMTISAEISLTQNAGCGKEIVRAAISGPVMTDLKPKVLTF